MENNEAITKRVFNITIHLNESEYIKVLKAAEQESRKPAEFVRLVLMENLQEEEPKQENINNLDVVEWINKNRPDKDLIVYEYGKDKSYLISKDSRGAYIPYTMDGKNRITEPQEVQKVFIKNSVLCDYYQGGAIFLQVLFNQEEKKKQKTHKINKGRKSRLFFLYLILNELLYLARVWYDPKAKTE